MALPNETDAPNICPGCGKELKLRVLHSSAGYYIGTRCYCGPYSRESGYYGNREEAQNDMDSGLFSR